MDGPAELPEPDDDEDEPPDDDDSEERRVSKSQVAQREAAGVDPPQQAMANHPPVWKHAHASNDEMDGYRHAYAATVSNVRAGTVFHPRASELCIRAQRDTVAVALALSGALPEMPRKSDGTMTTRDEQLKAAWFHRDRALGDCLPAALTFVQSLPRASARDQAIDHYEQAIHYLKNLNTSHAYADPRPQELLTLTIGDNNGEPMTVPQTVPAVVGPHGDYWNAISECFWALHYAHDFMVAINKLMLTRGYSKARLREIQGLYLSAQIWQLDCASKVAGVVDDPANRFCSILYVFDTWLNGFNSPKPGLPFILLGIMRQLAPMAKGNENFIEACIAHSEWWTHMNDAAWAVQTENEPIRKRCGLSPLEV
jgi:hypothetical protein